MMHFSDLIHPNIEREQLPLFAVEQHLHNGTACFDARVYQHSFFQHRPRPEADVIFQTPRNHTVLFPLPVDEAVVVLHTIQRDARTVKNVLGLSALLQIKIGNTDVPYFAFMIQANHLSQILLNVIGKMKPVSVHRISMKIVQIFLQGPAHLTGFILAERCELGRNHQTLCAEIAHHLLRPAKSVVLCKVKTEQLLLPCGFHTFTDSLLVHHGTPQQFSIECSSP